MSAIASAQMKRSPMLVLGGRAPAMRWGQGSLQEIDHVPFVRPLTKLAATADSTAEIPGLVDDALVAAMTPHSGPTFVDLPLDHVFMEAPPIGRAGRAPDAAAGAVAAGVERAAALLRDAERPVVMAGTGLYWGPRRAGARAAVRGAAHPVFLNGLARGCVPADHELFFSRARGTGLKGADVALVIGVPMDFRLGLRRLVRRGHRDHRARPRRAGATTRAASPPSSYGGLPATLDALRDGAGGPDRTPWVDALRASETEKREAERAEREDDRAPLHPMRLYAELAEVLDRDAILIGDGGDFVSYAGRVVDTYQPGCWLDPGPFGCLGSGPGYALAAKLAHPDRQVVLLLGDGAFGFSGMEFDTLDRHGVDVVGVMGNNGIWALEKHPMEFLYGYSVAADLVPERRYDQVVEALGGHGELVRAPGDFRGALERAFASGRPALVNVLTDPTVVYPRRSNLA
jgi:acetolactate synthase-1/2/3 large subunit